MFISPTHSKFANEWGTLKKNCGSRVILPAPYRLYGPPAELFDMLNCMANCLNMDIWVTSTNEDCAAHTGPGDPHFRLKAADIAPTMSWSKVNNCACNGGCGVKSAMNESKTASPNYHLQLTPGKYGKNGEDDLSCH
jgi:hypothetical protein